MIYKEVGDSIRSFIEEKMSEIDSSVYTQEDFDAYFSNEHINIVNINKTDKIMAFCCIIVINNTKYMGYSWCDKSYKGIKTYSYMIKYITSNYPEVQYLKDNLPTYIIKRIL